MRIVSLLPGATETVHALGLADGLVGRAQECVWATNGAATVTAVPVVGRRLAAGEAAAVGGPPLVAEPAARTAHAHVSRFALDTAALAAARPDVILSQEVCPVCAAAYRPMAGSRGSATTAAGAVDGLPVRLVSLAPRRLDEVVGQIVAVAHALDQPQRGQALHKTKSARLLALRMHVARYLVRTGGTRPRAVFLEGARLQRAPGLWYPDLVDAAGGIPLLAEAGGDAARVTLAALLAAQPDVLLIGTGAGGLVQAAGRAARLLAAPGWRELPAARSAARGRAWIVNLDAGFADPGPRIVEAAEVLLRIILPEALGANRTPPATDQAIPVFAAERPGPHRSGAG